MTAERPLIPELLVFFCALCDTESIGVEAIVAHMEEVHGHQVQRWPDGAVVVDMSNVPELLEE